MIIQTERLEIIPLSTNQLKLWIEDISKLEKELNCFYKAEPMKGFFLEIVKEQYEITQKDPNNYLWHSFFFLIRKEDRVVVGSADFKDIPNENGEVEIGYGLGKEFEKNGYMTEAAKAMCDWALKQNGVKNVIAETELDGVASQRILERCGFNIIVPAYANTTIDNKFMSGKRSYKYYNEFMWNGRYAECISLDETLKRMSKKK